jgi:dienelactone hydrolase
LASGALAASAQPLFYELRQPPEGREKLPTLPPVLVQQDGRPVADPAAWKDARAHLRRRWGGIIGPFPEPVPLDTQVVSTEALADHTRIFVRYRTDPVSRAEAYVLIPNADERSPAGKRPGAVVLHQTSKTHMRDPVGLDGREPMHMALHLVRRGYVCVAPRNFLWDPGGKTYQQATEAVLATRPWKTGMAKMTWDAIRATDVLLERPEVDPAKLCSIGHSLGGKEVLYHAAFDERIKAAVSCEGGVGVTFSNWDADWYLGKQVKTPQWQAAGTDHHELIALIAPRALLVIGGDGKDGADGAKSWPYIEANLPLWKMLGSEERLGLMRHGRGHDFLPPGEQRELVYRWLDHWVAAK